MAALAIAAAGAWAGSAAITGTVLGMTGAQIGWAVGSMVGGYVTAEDVVGPRIQDLKVQASTYGIPINIVYGTARIAGNVIWSTDLIEHENSESAKGGPESITYSYTVSCAVGLCEGEIAGVQKIWANNELIYDVTPDNTGDTGAALYNIAVYTGSETQTANARMQAEIGAANCPAHRGMAYVVFEDLPLEKFGNRVPNFNFQVVEAGTMARVAPTSINASAGSFPLYDQATNRMVTTGVMDNTVLVFTDVASGQTLTTITLPDSVADIYPGFPGTFWVVDQVNNIAYIYSFESMCLVDTVSIPVYGFHGAWNNTTNEMVIGGTGSSNSGLTVYTWPDWTARTVSTVTGTVPVWGSLLIIPSGYAEIAGRYSKDGWLVLYNGYNIVVMDETYTVRLNYDIPLPNTIYGNNQKEVAYDTKRDVVYLLNYLDDVLFVLDMDSLAITEYTIPSWVTNQEWIVYHEQSDKLIALGSGSQCWVSILDPDDLSNPETFVIYAPYNLGGWPIEVSGASDSVYTSTSINGLYQIPFYPRLTATPIGLGAIVEDQCIKSGLLAADVDVTALTDNVDGYVIVNQASARANIEPLQIGYFFDAVESDDVLKFVKRGGASAVTIPESDIGAYEYGSTMPALLNQSRTQETELPRTVSVNYLNIGADYQQGTQYDRRLTGNANIETTLSLPLALSDDSAAQIAAVNLYTAWANRNRVNFKTSLKYTRYEPTDILTITKGSITYSLRIVKKNEGGNGLIEWEGVSEDLNIYSQSVTGVAPGAMTGQTISSPVFTKLEMLDIPLLRDVDDGAGCYYAACGYRVGWDGMVLYRSADSGASWAQISSLTNESAIGASTTALGDFYGGYTVDEINSVTVRLSNTGLHLYSVSLINLLSGSNAAILGDEVIGFRDATQNEDGSYTLSGLLRGLRGTLWATSTHAPGDRFVVFSISATRRLDLDSSEIGLSRIYKGVSIYTTLAQTTAQELTNTAIGLKPYAPAHLGGGRNAAGDLTINWVRCSRTGGEWRDYVDASQPEASLAYEVEVWDSGYTTLKRTITSITSETTSYTAAQQTTDFGSAQATVYLRIYQLSAVVGRGYKLEGTI